MCVRARVSVRSRVRVCVRACMCAYACAHVCALACVFVVGTFRHRVVIMYLSNFIKSTVICIFKHPIHNPVTLLPYLAWSYSSPCESDTSRLLGQQAKNTSDVTTGDLRRIDKAVVMAM